MIIKSEDIVEILDWTNTIPKKDDYKRYEYILKDGSHWLMLFINKKEYYIFPHIPPAFVGVDVPELD